MLLGEALGNTEMSAAGMMGYTIESKAALEYWFVAKPHDLTIVEAK